MAEGGGGRHASGGREKTIKNYIDKRNTTVSVGVAPRPIFKACAKDTGYEGGGGSRIRGGVRRHLKNS